MDCSEIISLSLFFCRHHCMLIQLLFSLALREKSCFGSPHGIEKNNENELELLCNVYVVDLSFV